MVERVIPWWRKALNYALSGIRSLLGGGPNGHEISDAAGDKKESPALNAEVKSTSPHDVVLAEVSTQAAPAAKEVDKVVAGEPADSPLTREAEPETVLPADRAPEMIAEVKAILAAVDEVETEMVAAPAMLAVTADYDAISALEKIELAVEKVKPEAMEVETEMVPSPKAEEAPSLEVAEEIATAVTNEAVAESEAPSMIEEEPAAQAEAAEAESAQDVEEQSPGRTESAGLEAAPAVEEESEAQTESAETEVAPLMEEQPTVHAQAAEAEIAPAVEEQLPAQTELAETEIAPAVEEPQAVEPAPAVREEAEELAAAETLAPAEATAEVVPESAAEFSSQAAAEIPSAPSNAGAETKPVVEAAPIVPKSDAEQKTAARIAAAVKAREESSDPSPFSIFLGQVYEGPLDLLLDLIRKQDIDIYDIPIAKITAQFLAYVNQLKASDMDVAGEFIYTASLLIHIKSKMLLPRTNLGQDDASEDPRRELVERLLEHERFKNAAQMLQQKQMLEAATWTNPGVREFREDAGAEPEIAADTTDLVRIFREILDRARNRPIMNVEEDSVTVGQMIQFLARRLTMEDKPVALHKLLSHTQSARALIAMFLALLELVRLQAILLRQDRHFSEIFIKKHTGFEAVMDQGMASARDDWR